MPMPMPVPLGALSALVVLFAGPMSVAEAADPEPAAALKEVTAAQNTYLVLYRRGPAWVEGKRMRDQPGLREHFEYYLDVHREGRLICGGGFPDESGGAAVFTADSDEAAQALVTSDPAVRSGAFGYELKRWRLNPWDELAKRRAGS